MFRYGSNEFHMVRAALHSYQHTLRADILAFQAITGEGCEEARAALVANAQRQINECDRALADLETLPR